MSVCCRFVNARSRGAADNRSLPDVWPWHARWHAIVVEGGTMSRISLLMFALPLAACGDGGSTDIKGTLRFADRSDLEISRLVNAASGSEGFQAQAFAESYADPFEPTDPCP